MAAAVKLEIDVLIVQLGALGEATEDDPGIADRMRNRLSGLQPDNTLPGAQPPSGSTKPTPPASGGKPDQSLPGGGGQAGQLPADPRHIKAGIALLCSLHPDNALPGGGSRPGVDNTLPGSGAKPDQGLPPTAEPKK